jgi:hypothetical protein
MSGILETRWLSTIDCLGQGAMEESILHVQLVYRPLLGEGQRKDSANCGRLHNRTECL